MNPHTGTGPPPSTGDRAPSRLVRTPPRPARLALRPPTFPPGPLCGAWWPRTDDLMAELPALTEAFDADRDIRAVAPRLPGPVRPHARTALRDRLGSRRHPGPRAAGRAVGNLWPLALLSFGESRHNLHHADPTSARHGVDRGQIDPSTAVIRLLPDPNPPLHNPSKETP